MKNLRRRRPKTAKSKNPKVRGKKKQKNKKEILAILHNIRSIQNVGSIFRTSDASGVTKIYLTGYTPSPLDEMGKIRTDFNKTSLGAEKIVEWEKKRDLGRLLLNLNKKGIYILGLEQDHRAVNYKKIIKKYPLAVILGNEVSGLSDSILGKCDNVVYIPMHGKKESLNVSVAFGIFIYSVI